MPGAPPLPAEVGLLVGRQDETNEIRALVTSGERVITVVGPAGVGKSAFALHLAHALAPSVDGRSWFVDLADASDVSDVLGAVANSIGSPVSSDASADRVAAALGDVIAHRGPSLLVLDNFEQLVGLAMQTVGRWARRAPEARFVVTSREPLGIDGEVRFALGSLREKEARELLFERARRLERSFDPATVPDDVAAAIVGQLDGLPLAIELAAQQLVFMASAELASALANPVHALDLVPIRPVGRHHGLRAALDASSRALAPLERDVFAACSVMRGGFTLEVAQAVISAPEWPEADVRAALRSLVLRSVLSRQASSAERTLFALHSVTRAYATELLEASGIADAVHVRHAARFLEMGAELLDGARRGTDPGAMQELWRLRPNLIAAFEWLADHDPQRAAELGLVLDGAFTERVPLDEAWARANRTLALARSAGDAPLVLRALAARLGVARLAGDYQTVRVDAHAMLAHPEICAHPREEAIAHLAVAHVVMLLDGAPDADGTDHLRRAEKLAASLNEPWLLSHFLLHRAVAALSARAFGPARADLVRLLELNDRRPDRLLAADALANLTFLALREGRYREARRWASRAIDAARSVGATHVESIVESYASEIALHESRPVEAIGRAENAIALQRAAGSRTHVGYAQMNIGLAHFATGELDRAAAHLAESLREAEVMTYREGVVLRTALMGAVQAAMGDLTLAARAFAEVDERSAELPHVRGVAAVCRGFVDLAQCEHGPEPREAHLARARARLREPAGESDPRESIVRAILCEALERLAAPPARLEAALDCTWFRVPDGDRVVLRRRPALRRILQALVTAREEERGSTRAWRELLDAGWPDEEVPAKAAATRVHVAIRRLRALGLEAIIESKDDGYRIDPAVTIARAR